MTLSTGHPVNLSPARWIEYCAQRAPGASRDFYGVNPRIVEGMIFTETRGDNSVPGADGERGILQIMPGTAREINRQYPGRNLDRTNPVDCFEMATFFLGDMIRDDRHDGNENYVRMLTGYNGGPLYPARAAAYLALAAHQHRDNPALQAEYLGALNTMLEDADELGRGTTFRQQIRNYIAGENTRGGYGREFFYEQPRAVQRAGYAAFRAEVQGFLTADLPSETPMLRPQAGVSPAPTPPIIAARSGTPSIADNFNEQDKSQLQELVRGLMCVTTNRALPTTVSDEIRGSQAVLELQRNLEAAGLATDRGGADGRVDGIVGGKTREAIRIVERALGFTALGRVDGVMDQTVQAALRDPNFRNSLRAMVLDEAQDHNASDRVLTPPQAIVMARPRNLAERIFA